MFISQCVLFLFCFFLSWISDLTQALLYTFSICLCAHVYTRRRYLVNFSCCSANFSYRSRPIDGHTHLIENPPGMTVSEIESATLKSRYCMRTITKNWPRWVSLAEKQTSNKHRNVITAEAVTPISLTFERIKRWFCSTWMTSDL